MQERDQFLEGDDEFEQFRVNKQVNEMPMVDRIILDPIKKYK